MTRRVVYVTVEDTTWPVPLGETVWQLRYGPTPDCSIASVVDAYMALTDPDYPMKDATAMLRRARAARTSASLAPEEDR